MKSYETLTDSYGAQVNVQQSKAATVEGEDRGPWVWVRINGGGIKNNDGNAHLDIRDAVRVRDALTEFINENSAVFTALD